MTHVGQIRSDRSRSTVDHLNPILPFWDVVEDLRSTDPTHETCPINTDHAHCSNPTRDHELEHTDQESICRERPRPWIRSRLSRSWCVCCDVTASAFSFASTPIGFYGLQWAVDKAWAMCRRSRLFFLCLRDTLSFPAEGNRLYPACVHLQHYYITHSPVPSKRIGCIPRHISWYLSSSAKWL